MKAFASVSVTALLSAAVLAAHAGVDEPATVVPTSGQVHPSTALDDDSVRPLDASRRPLPAIEQDFVLPEPRRVKQGRTADDEVVRPGGPGFMPERALDDALVLPERTPVRHTLDVAPKPAARTPSAAARKEVAEDPAGRASEAGRPSREGKSEP